MNQTPYYANRNMRKKGDTKERPEQKLLFEILEHHISLHSKLEMEYKVHYKTEFGTEKDATLDIYLEFIDRKYAIRMMGGYHDRDYQEKKDDLQDAYLKDLGYQVIDISYVRCENLFKRHDRLLYVGELILAYKEVLPMLRGLGLPAKHSPVWIKNSEHRRQ